MPSFDATISVDRVILRNFTKPLFYKTAPILDADITRQFVVNLQIIEIRIIIKNMKEEEVDPEKKKSIS